MEGRESRFCASAPWLPFHPLIPSPSYKDVTLQKTENTGHDVRDECNRVGLVEPGRRGRVHGQQHRARVRRSRPAAVHTGHAAAADAVVFGRCHERSVGRQRIERAQQQQGAADGDQRAGTGQTVQIHVRDGSRGGIRRVAATRTDYRDVFLVDAIVHVFARRNANRHRRTGGHRPHERQEALEQVGLQSGAEEESAAVRHDRHIAENVLGHPVAHGQHRHDGHDQTTSAPSSADHCQSELRERRLLPVRTATRVPADHDHTPHHTRIPDHQTARVVAHAHRTPEHAAAEPVQVDPSHFGFGIAVESRSFYPTPTIMTTTTTTTTTTSAQS